jgi:biopolymer transport protein ExbB
MKMMKTVALLLLVVPSVVFGWWNNEWPSRKEIVLDTTSKGADFKVEMMEVPVLVRLHAGNFTAFYEVAEAGKDIRFVAGDDATPLKYHVEKIDTIDEMAFLWVKIPKLDANVDSAKIYMYYGNGNVPKGDDSGATFDVDQSLVLHFTDAAMLPQDSTAHANHAISSNVKKVNSSFISGGIALDGSNGILVPAKPSLQMLPEKGWTFSVWIKPEQSEGQVQLMRKGNDAGSISLQVNNGALLASYTNAQGIETAGTGIPLTAGQWQHISLTASADGMALYLNGTPTQSLPVAIAGIDGDLVIGTTGKSQKGYVGEMDEVRVSSAARTAEWIAAAHKIQGGEKLVHPMQAESGGSSGGNSYLGTILSNVSLDGWMVMFILGIMMVMSWFVIGLKAYTLSKMQMDNLEFMRAFRELDPMHAGALDVPSQEENHEFDGSPVLNTLFGTHERYELSNIYSVYHAGVHEVESRLGRSIGAASCLTPAAMRVVRASLDATMVRESQKLNSMMALLTIAISGGPFLGLLGTVLGVMITFAAIAVSGDVNIDAIAPGVSAALMTTVAGLIVAIPGLFGYNYLAIRIRDMIADMHVFADEFEAKMAEYHGI